MKKLYSLFAIVCALSVLTGCFTKAAAHAKKTVALDGTITLESDISIIGTGDKASQVAAEGMFADGADDALGAGVKNAKASQQSTGIKETFEGMGAFMGGLGQFMAASQGVPKVAAVKPASGDVEVFTDTEVTAAGPTLAALSEVTYSTDGYGGVPGAAGEGVYGRPSCSRCRAYHAAHPDVAIINLDDPGNRTAFWKALSDLKFKGTNVALPVVITASGYTAAAK